MNRAKLVSWLNSCVYQGHDGQGLRALSLRHIDADERGSSVREWKTGQGFSVDTTASEIEAEMTQDAIGLGDTQRYVVHAYFGTSTTPGRRFTQTIDGVSHDDSDSFGRSEPATEKGHRGQLMRHNENLHKLSVQGSAELIRILRAECESLRGMVAQMTQDKIKLMETYETLISNKHQRDMDIADKQFSQQVKMKAIETVTLLAPVAVNKITGQKLLPEAVSPQIMALKGAVKKIPPEIWQMIENHLAANDPAALAALVETMELLNGA